MATVKLCSVADCGKPHSKRGYCNTHFLRWKRHGDPLTTKRRVDSNNCGKKECPAAKKILGHIHYIQNSDAYKANARDWRERNPDSYERRKLSYFGRPEIQEKARQKGFKSYIDPTIIVGHEKKIVL